MSQAFYVQLSVWSSLWLSLFKSLKIPIDKHVKPLAFSNKLKYVRTITKINDIWFTTVGYYKIFRNKLDGLVILNLSGTVDPLPKMFPYILSKKNIH
jgi:hypothetical protein